MCCRPADEWRCGGARAAALVVRDGARRRRRVRVLAAGVGPGGAAADGALRLRASGAGRRLCRAAPLHPYGLRPVLLAALRLAAARPPRLGAAGAALPPRPARSRCLWRGGRRCLAQPPPPGLLRRALHTQVGPFDGGGGTLAAGAGAGALGCERLADGSRGAVQGQS